MISKLIRILKLIVINLITFAILLIFINWVCGVYINKSGQATREQLPNYEKDYEHARAVFRDYTRVKHRYEPFVGWKTLPYTGQTTNISKKGLRVHQPESSNRITGKVVRFFGGSTMWGEGSDDQHTIPALFHSANPQYAVHNHAQLAYNTRQELDALISLYSGNDSTDIVIFYDGVNDAAFLCPEEINELPAHRLVPMYRDKLYVGVTAPIKEILKKIFIEDILKVIHKFTYKPTPENSPYDCTTNPDKAEAIAEIMMRNWEMAHELVTRRGGKFLAILQPAAFIGSPRTDHLKLDEELGKNFKEIYGRLKEKIAARNHPWIIDLSDKFNGEEYIFIDFCHVSPNGNEIIAKEISRAVETLQD
jgi:hypothetical protein